MCPCPHCDTFNQCNRFGKQLHACPMFVLLPAVFQPQRSVIVRVQVLIGNGYHIRIRDPGITPEEKHIPCQYVRFTMRFNFHITDFLERFTAQCPWGFIRLLGQGEMLEMDFVCIAFLISQTAYFSVWQGDVGQYLLHNPYSP